MQVSHDQQQVELGDYTALSYSSNFHGHILAHVVCETDAVQGRIGNKIFQNVITAVLLVVVAVVDIFLVAFTASYAQQNCNKGTALCVGTIGTMGVLVMVGMGIVGVVAQQIFSTVRGSLLWSAFAKVKSECHYLRDNSFEDRVLVQELLMEYVNLFEKKYKELPWIPFAQHDFVAQHDPCWASKMARTRTTFWNIDCEPEDREVDVPTCFRFLVALMQAGTEKEVCERLRSYDMRVGLITGRILFLERVIQTIPPAFVYNQEVLMVLRPLITDVLTFRDEAADFYSLQECSDRVRLVRSGVKLLE